MSERIVILRHTQYCDICHRKIHAGEKARIIYDDFGGPQVWFEHLRCPRNHAAITDCFPTFPVPQKMMFV